MGWSERALEQSKRELKEDMRWAQMTPTQRWDVTLTRADRDKEKRVATEERAVARQQAPAPASLLARDSELFSIADAFVKSGYFTDVKDVSQAVVKILAGREAGFGPMASIRGIHIVQGKPTWSAELVASAIKRNSRYNYRVDKLTDDECQLTFTEHGEIVGQSIFTWKDAEKAKLTGKEVWRNYPRNMLFSRALTNGSRWFCPDLFGGIAVEVSDEEGGELADREEHDVADRKRDQAPLVTNRVVGIFQRPTAAEQEAEDEWIEEVQTVPADHRKQLSIAAAEEMKAKPWGKTKSGHPERDATQFAYRSLLDRAEALHLAVTLMPEWASRSMFHQAAADLKARIAEAEAKIPEPEPANA